MSDLPTARRAVPIVLSVLCACGPKANTAPVGALEAPAGKGAAEENPAHAALVAASKHGALAVYDALEELIDAGSAEKEDRRSAFDLVVDLGDDGSAEYAFARCGLAGRLAEGRGLKALGRIKEAAHWGRLSVDRDPALRGGANRQTLGTIYVLAGDHLDEGDSEEGLEMLEDLVAEFPEDLTHRLRVAQAYVELGDPDPGLEHLCTVRAGRGDLRPHEQVLLDALVDETEASCPAGGDG